MENINENIIEEIRKNFKQPHEIIVIENIEDSVIKIDNSNNYLRILKISPNDDKKNVDITISTFEKSMIRSILIENCHNCQVFINSCLLNIKLIDCSEITLKQICKVIKAIEILRCYDSIIYIKANIPLVQIEQSHNFSICQKNEVIDYFITGDCERVYINTVDNLHRLKNQYVFDMVITDRLFSFDLVDGMGESRIEHFTALSII
jgi:hypothetical protein